MRLLLEGSWLSVKHKRESVGVSWMGENKPSCYGNFLKYPSVICQNCKFWRQCIKEGGDLIK